MGLPVGYFAVTGAAAYSIMHYPHPALTFSIGAIAIYLIYGIAGMVQMATCSPDVDNIFGIVSNLAETLPLGLVVTELYLSSKKFHELAYAHAAIGAAPVLLDFFMQNCQMEKFKDLSVFANSASLIYLGIEMKSHPCYIVLALVTLLNHFGGSQIADKLELPRNYVLPIGYGIICILIYLQMNVLAATYGISNYTTECCGYGWSLAMFHILKMHGIIGIIHYMIARQTTKKLYDISLNIVQILPLPFINTEIFLVSGFETDIAHIHAITALVPLVCDLFFIDEDGTNENFKDLVIIGSATSLILLSVMERNFRYFTLGLIGLSNRFSIEKPFTREHNFTIGLILFCLIANRIVNVDM